MFLLVVCVGGGVKSLDERVELTDGVSRRAGFCVQGFLFFS